MYRKSSFTERWGVPCLLVLFLIFHNSLSAQTVLMFVPHEETYYSEYIVMRSALEQSGYIVDVRSANDQDFAIYMDYADLAAAANDYYGGDYNQFLNQYDDVFGQEWSAALNEIPASATVNGSIIDVIDMENYAGLVVVGGFGALDYRVDGEYESQGEGDREISAQEMEQASEKLNDLAILALSQNKPVMAQCHGSSLPAYWRVPGTFGEGIEEIGFSILKGQEATGFPDNETPEYLEELDITYKINDRVTISDPYGGLFGDERGKGLILTTRDWYPQTVAHAAKTFINILETYPDETRQVNVVKTLVLHGGALDEENCENTNKSNDVPCNYGEEENDLPADYTHLMNVLDLNAEGEDHFIFENSELDITQASLPFSSSIKSEIDSYFQDFDVIIFYKHWSTGLTDQILQALVDFADNGGGLIALHHGLFNDVDGDQTKNILTNLFGAESALNEWSGTLGSYNLFSMNHGHFISSYLIDYPTASEYPEFWVDNLPVPSSNFNYSFLPTIEVYDEIYDNMVFLNSNFGNGVNEINPLFSNDLADAEESHVSGFTRLIDIDGGETIGKLVYLQIGERRENYEPDAAYSQMVRNAVLWSAPIKSEQEITFELDEQVDLSAGNIQLVANVTSGNGIVFHSSNENVISISGNVATLVSSGTAQITASQNGNSDYYPASISRQITVVNNLETTEKEEQSITFHEIPKATYGDAPFVLSANTSSGLVVSFSSNNAEVASVNGSTITALSAGTVSITASQPGNDKYLPADPVVKQLKIGKKSLIATVNDTSVTYGNVPAKFKMIFQGFVHGDSEDNLDVLPEVSTSATNASGVGNYEINVLGGSDNNYTIIPESGQLKIDKHPLFISVRDTVMKAGESIDNFTFNYDGFQNGEDWTVIDELPYIVDLKMSELTQGEHEIVLTGGTDGNYDLILGSGVLTIQDAALGLSESILSIYPNPASGIINLYVSEIGPSGARLMVVDISGQVHLQQKVTAQSTEISISTLAKGLYFVHVDIAGDTLIEKIIKSE